MSRGRADESGATVRSFTVKEEEAEREEALAAAQTEMGAIDGEGIMEDDLGMTQGEEDDEEGMERDLDEDIPEAEEGLVEEGEEGEDIGDEEGYMERDLDEDIPEGYDDDGYDDGGLYEEEVEEEAKKNDEKSAYHDMQQWSTWYASRGHAEVERPWVTPKHCEVIDHEDGDDAGDCSLL